MQVAACGLRLIADDSKQGTIAFLHVAGRIYEYIPSKAPLRRLHLGQRQGETLAYSPQNVAGDAFLPLSNCIARPKDRVFFS